MIDPSQKEREDMSRVCPSLAYEPSYSPSSEEEEESR
jgi:hypothetical protein